MTQKELKRIFSKGECLSLDALRLYNEGKLSKKSMHEVETHLLECNLCSGAVDGLNTKRIAEVNKLSEHIQRRLAVYMNTPPRVPFFQRFGLTLIAGVILLAVGGTCVYISLDKNEEKPVLTDSSAIQKKQDVSTSGQPGTGQQYVSSSSGTSVSVPAEHVNLVQETVEGQSPVKETTPLANPGSQPNPLPQNQQTAPSTSPLTQETVPGPGSNTRTENSVLRVKTVQIYPAVTHNDKASRKEAKDGQLGKPSSNSSSFELDEMPYFPGGNEALRNYIITNFKPTSADKSNLKKYATGVRFIVNSKTGAISAPEISVSISPEIDKEILRVISAMPNYTPGKKRGEVEVMIGITFE